MLPHSEALYVEIARDEAGPEDEDLHGDKASHARSAAARLQPFAATDPSTWTPYLRNADTLLLLVERLAREFAVSGASSARLRASFEVLEGHLKIISDLDEPLLHEDVRLQTVRLVNLVRDQRNSERAVDVEKLRTLAFAEENKADPYAVAEARMLRATPPAKKRWRKNFSCNKCGLSGHTEDFCRRAPLPRASNDKGQGNDKGGNAKWW